MKNPVTGKYEARKVFKKDNFEVVGVGDTKEEAKADLKKKLQDYLHPLAHLPGYRGPKYVAKRKVVGKVNSPGYVARKDETGRVTYEFDENRMVEVYGVDRSTPSEGKTE